MAKCIIWIICGFLSVFYQYALNAQTKPANKTISEVYEEIPVVLFEAPADVVKRMREEFTPSPIKTPEVEEAEKTCRRYLIQQRLVQKQGLTGKIKEDTSLWLDTLNRTQRLTAYHEAMNRCTECSITWNFYKTVYSGVAIGKTYIILKEHKNPDTLEILGLAPIRPVFPSTDKPTLKKILATQTFTAATLSVRQLQTMPTKVTQTLKGGITEFIKGSIEHTNHTTMYDYLYEWKNYKNQLYNTQEILRGIVLRKLDGTIDAITGLDYYRQPEITQSVLLYETPMEVVVRFREEFTPMPVKTPLLEQAEQICPTADSIKTKLSNNQLIPKSLLDPKPNECEMLLNYYKIWFKQQIIQKVFIITSDVSEGSVPGIIGSCALGDVRRNKIDSISLSSSFPIMRSGSLYLFDLQQFHTITSESEQNVRGSIIGSTEKTMDEYFRSVLRSRRYGKVYKANLLTYVKGYYNPIRITDVVELPK